MQCYHNHSKFSSFLAECNLIQYIQYKQFTALLDKGLPFVEARPRQTPWGSTHRSWSRYPTPLSPGPSRGCLGPRSCPPRTPGQALTSCPIGALMFNFARFKQIKSDRPTTTRRTDDDGATVQRTKKPTNQRERDGGREIERKKRSSLFKRELIS